MKSNIQLLLIVLSLLVSFGAKAQNTVPAGCITTPLPTTPSGPTWKGDFNTFVTSEPKVARVTVWRKPCTNTTAVTLATFEILSSNPFVCSSSSAFIQNSTQFTGGFSLAPSQGSSLCTNLLVTTTAILMDRSSTTTFNPSNAFTFIPDATPASGVATLRLEIPAYNAADYGINTALPISGKQSGNWFNPARNGEGFMLEIGSNSNGTGKTIVASWYTYKNGQQQWIYGSQTLTAGATSVQIPMLTTRGAQFGSSFVSTDVIVEPWGTVSWTFPGCNSATVVYTPNSGAPGTLQLQRILSQIDGLPCP